MGRFGEAAELHRRVVATQTKIVGEAAPAVAVARFHLAADLAAQGAGANRAEARRLFDQALTVLRRVTPAPQRLADLLRESSRLAGLEGDRERSRRELAESAALSLPHSGR